MKKNLKYVFFILAYFTFHSNCWAHQNYETLKVAAARYIDFLKLVGNSDVKTYANQMPTLCASDVKKIMNGKTAVTTRDNLVTQLGEVRDMVGTWTIENLDTVVSPADHSCIVRYVLKTAKDGSYITLAILRYDHEGMITEINEVYNKF